MVFPLSCDGTSTHNADGSVTVSISIKDSTSTTLGSYSTTFPAGCASNEFFMWIRGRLQECLTNNFSLGQLPASFSFPLDALH